MTLKRFNLFKNKEIKMQLLIKISLIITAILCLVFTTFFAWYFIKLGGFPYGNEKSFIEDNVVYRKEYVPFYGFFVLFY